MVVGDRPGAAERRSLLRGGRLRRLALLDAPLPVLFVETTPGCGADELIAEWQGDTESTELRVAVRADAMVASGEEWLGAVARLTRAAAGGVGPARDARRTAGPGAVGGGSGVIGLDAAGDRVGGPGGAAGGEALVAFLRRAHRQVVIAVTRADFLSADAFDALAGLLVARDRVRLIVAGMDLSILMRRARSHGIGYARLDDRDLALSDSELAALLAGAGLAHDPATVAAVRRVSRGLPAVVTAMIDATLAQSPSKEPSHDGPRRPVIDPGVAGAYLVRQGVAGWPTPLVGFIRALAQVPRLTMVQAAMITGVADARALVGRMVALGLGETAFHPGLRQPVFTWSEAGRTAVRTYFPKPEDLRALRGRIGGAARGAFDDELLVANYVASGRLADAEEHLCSWLWDVLPNGYSPLWEPLIRCAPTELSGLPNLIYLRIRVDPRGPATPVTARLGADLAQCLTAREASWSDPWQRLADLALAVELARLRRDIAGMVEPLGRARSLVADLITGDFFGAVGRSAVSSLLLVAEALVRVGASAVVAAEFARRARDLLDVGPAWLDPSEHRRGFASRVDLLARREAGLMEPPDAASIAAGPQFRWRDADIAVQGLLTLWAEIDAGDGAAAVRACREALDRVVDADQWPGLWFPQVAIASSIDRAVELRSAVGRYRESCAAVGLRLDASPASPDASLPTVVDENGAVLPPPGLELAGLDVRSLVGGMRATDGQPRWQYHRAMFAALSAVRSGNDAAARPHLVRAAELAARRPLSPALLVAASVEEIDRMRAAIEGHPDAAALRLEEARESAHRAPTPAVQLSDREAEVLSMLRGGCTNKAIAAGLYVSVNTVKFHRTNLMRKLGASSRQQLLAAAERAGL